MDWEWDSRWTEDKVQMYVTLGARAPMRVKQVRTRKEE